MVTVPIQDQIDCIKREIAMRERTYPTLVERRRLSQEQANRELTRMRAVQCTLELLKQQHTITD